MSEVGAIVGNLARTVAGVITGGTSERIITAAQQILGDDTAGFTPEQKMALQAAQAEADARALESVNAAANEAERNVTERVAQLEGTAADLLVAGRLGKVVLFFRGAQRPIWGFSTLYMDFMVFSGQWQVPAQEHMTPAFWTINALVLGFLFGERAVKNVIPLVGRFLRSPPSAG